MTPRRRTPAERIAELLRGAPPLTDDQVRRAGVLPKGWPSSTRDAAREEPAQEREH